MAAAAWNRNNPGVKRIMQEMKELKSDPSSDFIAEALETDIFEWHFVMRGPADSEFEGGIYHGRILLPAEYPFKPPGFMMLSPTGRFETGVKICLSISSHHPEHWQDSSKDERIKLALKSRSTPPQFGTQERQRVVNEMHQRMLALELGLQLKTGPKADDSSAPTSASDASVTVSVSTSTQLSPAIPSTVVAIPTSSTTDHSTITAPASGSAAASATALPESVIPARAIDGSRTQLQQPSTSHTHPPCSTPHCLHGEHSQQALQPQQQQPGQFTGDRGLNLLAVVLAVGILAILFRKVLAANGWIDGWVMGMFS